MTLLLIFLKLYYIYVFFHFSIYHFLPNKTETETEEHFLTQPISSPQVIFFFEVHPPQSKFSALNILHEKCHQQNNYSVAVI